MQVKLAGEPALLDETVLLIQVDGGKIIDAHTQVDLANRSSFPGPIEEIRQHTAPDPEIPVFAQDGHPKLTGMLEARTLARAEGQCPCDFTSDFGDEIETGRRFRGLPEKRPFLLHAQP